jgi:hypothetical protein
MKQAIVDQIILWIILFVSFVTIFYLVIDYYMVIKTKDQSDLLSNYGARMKALGKDDATVVAGLNTLKGDYFQTIQEANLSCVNLATERYQIIFTTNIHLKNSFLNENDKIYSRSSAFNEINATDINCSLNLSTP